MADPAANVAAENTQKLENAIRAVNHKKPVPEIDFTLHTNDDGTQVSTLERVCKGMYQTVSQVLGGKLVLDGQRDLQSKSC